MPQTKSTMIKQINFNRTTDAMGRNGILKQTGIEVMEASNNTIVFSPTTKWGVSESCFLEIPEENVAELFEALAGFKTVHSPAFHVLHILSGVEIKRHGPYPSEWERDEAAKKLFTSSEYDPETDSIFKMDGLDFEPYPNSFFE